MLVLVLVSIPLLLLLEVTTVLDVLVLDKPVEVGVVDVDTALEDRLVLLEGTVEVEEVDVVELVDVVVVKLDVVDVDAVELVDAVVVELDVVEEVVVVVSVVGLVVPPVVVTGLVPMANTFAFAIAYTLPLPKTGLWFFMSLPVLTGSVICCRTPFTGTALYATRPMLTSTIQTIPVPGCPLLVVTTGTPFAAKVRELWPANVKNGFPSGPRPKL